MIRGIFRPRKAISRRFSCYDMTMNIAPGAILTATGLVVNVSATVYRFVTDQNVTTLLLSVANILCGLFPTVFILGAITTVTEWRSIYCPAWKRSYSPSHSRCSCSPMFRSASRPCSPAASVGSRSGTSAP